MQFIEQTKGGAIGHLHIIATIIDVEPKSDIGQELGVFVDLFYSKNQSQDMLVEFCHCTANRHMEIYKQ